MSRESLNQRIVEIADAIKPELVLDATTNVTVAKDEAALNDVFSKYLPPELTMDGVKAAQEFTLDVAAAVTLAHGELQQDHMLANPDLKSGSLKVKLGHSTIENSYERERSGVAMGKPWKKNGVSNTDITTGTGRKVTDFKKVVSYLGDSAASVFAN